MLDLGLTVFTLGLLALGFRRPFVWTLAYLYIDILSPQKISYRLLTALPISLIAFVLAFVGWAMLDDKRDSRFTLRQGLILLLLLYCGVTTMGADFPKEALDKWSWVWKALVFAAFLPLTLRTRLRIEATVLVMVLSIAAIIIDGGIKTAAGGGGYGELHLFLNDNTGLYEGSIISCVAIAVIPLVWWLVRHGTVFPADWRVKLFALALTFACLLMPVGTQARTGLLCVALLAVLSLRSVKRPVLAVLAMVAVVGAAVPFLPKSYTERMSTIQNNKTDESAQTRVAVWNWTLDYVREHPFGGGFDAYRGNHIRIETVKAAGDGNNVSSQVQASYDQARAYHSSYFEMLGEQGWAGLGLWLWLMLSGVWQMERIHRRWKKRGGGVGGAGERWQAPLAIALQQSLLVYMLGSTFVGIAFQPFCYMLIGLQCALWSYCRRTDSPAPGRAAVARGLRLHPAPLAMP